MAKIRNKIELDDSRTGKHYAMFVGDEEHREKVLEYLAQKMEYDFQMSLPPDKRSIANQPTNFKCPHCKTKNEPTSRKQSMVMGWMWGFTTHLKDVFFCKECSKEFTQEELRLEQRVVEKQNREALLVERYKSNQINTEQLEAEIVNLYSFKGIKIT